MVDATDGLAAIGGLTMNAGGLNDRLAGHPQSTLDVHQLVSMALEDEQLRKAVEDSDLRRAEIIEAVDAAWARSPLWEEAVQIDTRGRVDEAQRRVQALAERRARYEHRSRWWRATGYLLAALIAGLATIAGLDSDPAATVALYAAVAAFPFAIAGLVLARRRLQRQGTIALEGQALAEDLLAARHEVAAEVADSVVKATIRSELNAREGARYDTRIGRVKSEGLAEILRPDYLVPTAATQRLDRCLKDMPGGSIGLSGPRGAGKSSLIQARCPSGDDQPADLLGVVVSAPVQFDPREFILHLFSELCMAVLGREEVERLRNPAPPPRPASALGWALLAFGLLASAGAATLVAELWGRPSNATLGAIATAVGVWGCLAALMLRRLAARRSVRDMVAIRIGDATSNHRFPDDVRTTAERQLRAIWFQQTFSEGWSGSLKLPGGLQGGVEGGRELARLQMSLPDVVSELRRLIRAVTAEGVRVRIGIDELDKIGSPEEAARFFNEIKVLFGIEDCFFLVSVSEDALAGFERRGMPVRDVFDSSFDDVIRLRHLDAHDSMAMLRERIVGLPTPFLLLCHCLSGGLPRDLIRAARDLVSLLPSDDDEPQLGLSQACRELVAAQLAAKSSGVATVARRELPPQDAVAIRDLADRLALADPASTSLQDFVRNIGSAARDRSANASTGAATGVAPAAFAAELATFAYFCMTLVELFDERHPEQHFAVDIHQERRDRNRSDRSIVDRLALARQAFAVHPRAAWTEISAARSASGYLEALDYPFQTVFTGVGAT